MQNDLSHNTTMINYHRYWICGGVHVCIYSYYLHVLLFTPPSKEKNSPYLNKCIFVIVNASVYLFKHFRKVLALQQDFKQQHTAVFMITSIGLFKYGPFFPVGGGGGGDCCPHPHIIHIPFPPHYTMPTSHYSFTYHAHLTTHSLHTLTYHAHHTTHSHTMPTSLHTSHTMPTSLHTHYTHSHTMPTTLHTHIPCPPHYTLTYHAHHTTHII